MSSKEDAFLNKYFLFLRQNAFDKAKDLSDRERDVSSQTNWGVLVSCLSHLAMAEKAYTSLQFYEKKLLFSKNNLSSSYQFLANELEKLSDQQSASLSSQANIFLRILPHLAKQLSEFVNARCKLIGFYTDQLSMMGSKLNMTYNDLLIILNHIMEEHKNSFHHPILASLKATFSLECKILENLLQVQVCMSHFEYLPALLNLQAAHQHLEVCLTMTPVPTKKFFSSSKSQIPSLYDWLNQFKGFLFSKFSLYFFASLSKEGEMKPYFGKDKIDFYSKILSFKSKTNPQNISIILHAEDLEFCFGYRFPHKALDKPIGVNSYPAIFSCPKMVGDDHKPTIISLLQETSYNKPLYHMEEKFQCCYFVTTIEPRFSLVLIFSSKKSERDHHITSFIQELTSLLRCTRLLVSLNGKNPLN